MNNSNNKEDLIEEAKKFESQNKLKEALDCYIKAITLDPQNSQIKQMKILTEQKIHLENYQKHSEEAKSLADKVYELFKEGDFEEVVRISDEALAIDQNFVFVLYNKAMALRMMNNDEGTVLLFKKILEIEPNNVDVLNNLGIMMKNSGKFKEALEYYDKALEIDPTLFESWQNKGNVLMRSSKFEEAIEYLDEALKFEPNHVPTLVVKSITLERLNKLVEAEEFFEKAKGIDAFKSYYLRGLVLEDFDEESREAAASLNQAYKLNPLSFLIERALKYDKLNRIEAVSYYEKAIKIDPKNKELIAARSKAVENLVIKKIVELFPVIYLDGKECKDNQSYWTSLYHKLPPDYRELLIIIIKELYHKNPQECKKMILPSLTSIYSSIKKLSEVLNFGVNPLLKSENKPIIEFLEKFKTFVPREPLPYFKLGEVLASMGENESSASINYERFLKYNNPNDYITYQYKANRYIGEYKIRSSGPSYNNNFSGEKELLKAFVLNPNDTSILFILGIGYNKCHNYEKAAKYFGDYLKFYPDNNKIQKLYDKAYNDHIRIQKLRQKTKQKEQKKKAKRGK